MIHWCHEETALLIAGAGAIRLAWWRLTAFFTRKSGVELDV
jgi:hypothetical protein